MTGPVVPEAKEALNKFKMEAAREVGVDLKDGYNGQLTSKEAGSVGGQMIKNIIPVRTYKFERTYRIKQGHKTACCYRASLSI